MNPRTSFLFRQGTGLLAVVAALGVAASGCRSAGSPRPESPRSAPEAPPFIIDEQSDRALVPEPALEALEPALRAYEAGDHQRAAILLADLDRPEAGDAARAAARFYLVKSLVHLGFRWSALSAIMAIEPAPDDPFRVRLLPWLSLIARELPDDDVVIQALQGFEVSEIEEGCSDQSPDCAHHLALLLSRRQASEGSLPEAAASLERIPRGSPWYLEARLRLGVIHIRTFDAPAALRAFHDMLRATGGAAEPNASDRRRRLVELAWMNAARLHFSVASEGNPAALSRALAAYARVRPESDLYAEMLFERAWCRFRREQYDRTTASLDALPEAFVAAHPEVRYLRILVLYERGDREGVIQAAAALSQDLEPVADALAAWLADRDQEQIFEAVRAQPIDPSTASPSVRFWLAHALSTSAVRRHRALLSSIEDELARFEAAPPELRDSEAGARILQDLVLQQSLEQLAVGTAVMFALRRIESDLREMVTLAEAIQITVLRESAEE